MIQLCKLTTQELTTHGGFQWELNVPAPELTGEGELCGPGFYHCYTHPLLAVLMNPIHAGIKNPRLFLIEAGGVSADDHGLKMGFTQMKLTEEIPLPEFTLNQRITFAIYCALETGDNDAEFKPWAEDWLSGKDRSEAAAAAAEAAAWTAAWAAAGAAAEAAWAAAGAAAEAAGAAAGAAAEAARAAAQAGKPLDLIALAERAYNFERE